MNEHEALIKEVAWLGRTIFYVVKYNGKVNIYEGGYHDRWDLTCLKDEYDSEVEFNTHEEAKNWIFENVNHEYICDELKQKEEILNNKEYHF